MKLKSRQSIDLGVVASLSRGSALAVTLALAIATLLLTRHAQFPALSGLAAPWALLLVISTLRVTPTLLATIPMLMYSALSVTGAMLAGHEPALALRFAIILTGTLLAFNVRPAAVSAPWVMAPLVLQAMLITLVSVVLGVLQDPVLASTIRFTALENGWGDIYSFDGVYFRVQVIGNALLPLLFMVCLWRWGDGRFYAFGLVVASMGLVAAGNLTYFITIALALAARGPSILTRSVTGKLLAVIAAVAVAVYTWNISDTLFERKFDGTDSSMGVRYDQIATAYEHADRTPTRLLFGAGLGAKFPDGRERDYSQYQYIELQALYLTYQIGLVGMAIYLLSVAYMARNLLSPQGRAIFWLYVFSGISNPYILDTNQIVATVILVHLFPRAPKIAHG